MTRRDSKRMRLVWVLERADAGAWAFNWRYSMYVRMEFVLMRARSAKSERYPGPAKVPSWAPIGAALIATGQIMVSSEQTSDVNTSPRLPRYLLSSWLQGVALLCYLGFFTIILMD